MKSMWRFLASFFALIVALSFLNLNMMGCSGGSSDSDASSGTTDSIDLPDQMSLVADDSSTNASVSKFVKFATASPGGDYASDAAKVETYVDDHTGDTMAMINDILCMMGQTKAEDMLDQGAYLAMIEVSKCEKDKGSEQENTSSGQSVEFETWTVNAIDDGDGTATIYVWIPPTSEEDNYDPFNEIRIKIDVTDGMTEANPYGVWQMNFVGLMDGTVTTEGYLASIENADGNIELAMRIDGGEYFNESTHAILSPDRTSGQARVEHFFNYDSGDDAQTSPASDGSFTFEEVIDISFNEDYFSAEFGGGVGICLDRADITKNVWRYNLYNSTTGAKADINSGMSIRLASDTSDEFNHESFGWAGYWGIWPSENFPHGTAVVDDNDNAYTSYIGGIKLTKNTREDLMLNDVTDVIFSLRDENTHSNVQVKWNGTQFMKLGTESCSENGCEFTEITPTALTVEANQWIGLWSHGMGRLDLIVPSNGQLSGTTAIALYRQQFMAPSDFSGASVSFKCYYSCPKPVTSQSQANSSDVYFPDIEGANGTPYTYTLDLSTFKMSVNGQELKVANGVSLENTSQQWGIGSGAMVTSSTSVAKPWEIWQSAEFYNFEFGTNDWNKFTGLKDSNGIFVDFDPPMQCLGRGEDMQSPEGESNVTGVYMLDYQGEGNLFGIPFDEVTDEDTGFTNWQNSFLIPDGTVMSCSNGTEEADYVTRQMSIMHQMKKVDMDVCDAADLPDEELTEPEDLFVDPEMDEAPSVTDAPAVVSGEFLDTDGEI